jgi:membrane-bound lytic murein transglycosylase D
MNSTRPPGSLWLRGADLILLLCALFGCFALPANAGDDLMPRPPELEPAVQFWIRVYSQIDTNSGFLHDDENLAVVYETLHFSPSSAAHERQRAVEEAREHYAEILRHLAGITGPFTPEEQRVRDLWGPQGSAERLREAVDHIRFQLGQSDRFREGLRRSGAWQQHIADTLSSMGLPPELAVLPHVESSFNPAAYSKVGAAGLWQFMRSTGRRYLHIDSSVDDRLDPFRSTQAAAQLLAYNYHLLGTWPLALTAYNHGAEGMRRAKETLGTDDIVTIIRNYKSRTFGFASRNFYCSFLAALEIDHNPEKYFGDIEPSHAVKFQEVVLPAYMQVGALAHALKIDPQKLEALNPSLLPAVWNGQRHVPKGYHLRVPADIEKLTSEELAARLSPHELFASQLEPRRYRVQRGDSLATIAARYSMSTQDLAQLNGLSPSAKVRPGRSIVVPSTQPAITLVARNEATPEAPAAAAAPAAAKPSAAAPIARISGATTPTAPPAAKPAAAPAAPPVLAAATPPTGAIPAELAKIESDVDAEQVAKVGRPAARAEPVSAAQAEELSPALGPSIEVAATADPTDYSIAKDDTIKVATDETLGHYADWLGTSAARLRVINHLTFRKPVLIGHKIKLEFVNVSREDFEEKRREYHRTQEATYFAAHRIVGTDTYLARRGDSGWTLIQHNPELPLWLLQQYNPDLNLAELHPGTQIVLPKIEEVSSAGG